MKRLLLCVALISTCAGPFVGARGQTNTPAPAARSSSKPAAAGERPATERKARSLPYRGKLVSVDKQRGCLTVGTRVFVVSAKTKIEKEGKPATLNDGVAGQIVTGSFRKLPDGKLEAVSVYFGGKTGDGSSGQKKAGTAEARKEKG